MRLSMLRTRTKATASSKVEMQWVFRSHDAATFLCAERDPDAARYGENAQALWQVSGRALDECNAPLTDAELTRWVLGKKWTSTPWGRFHIVAMDKCTGRLRVASSPCVTHPRLYSTAFGSGFLVAHSVRDFDLAAEWTREPDWTHLHQYLAWGRTEHGTTGWRLVRAMEPGWLLDVGLSGDVASAKFWSPLRRPPDRFQADVLSALDRVARYAFQGHSDILLDLSGGLDSTAMAIALRDNANHARVRCVTFVDPARAASNEAENARRIAVRCGFEHHLLAIDRCLAFAPARAAPLVSRPSTGLCFLARDAVLARSGLWGNRTISVSGHGGDALLLASPPPAAAVDAFLHMRPVRAVRALFAAAIINRQSIWETLSHSMKDACRADGGAFPPPTALFSIAPIARAPRPLFDELLSSRALSTAPTRRQQIALYGATLDEVAAGLPSACGQQFFPFLMQPALEAALHHRPEDLFSAFADRIPLRRALYQRAAVRNAWRIDKGDTTRSVIAGLRTWQAHVRANCLDGACAQLGLVDRPALERLIRRIECGEGTHLSELIRIFAVEIFLQAAKQDRAVQ